MKPEPTIQILPSLLAADPGRLEEACRRAAEAGVDGLHLDIMDGRFVRNISMGPDVVSMARRAVRLPLSVHLMVAEPEYYADRFAEAGADTVLIHVEARCDARRVLRGLRSRGVRAGITLNPETPAEAAFDLLDEADEILCMTVHPGFGGQAFIPTVLPKIAALRARAPGLDLSVDGGLNDRTSALAVARGANVFLVGSWLFQGGDLPARVRQLRERIAAAAPRSAA
jgi:ribulose-phosphate 3-epimerase